MAKKLTVMVAVLLWCGVSTALAANIIVVTEHVDRDLDRIPDDQGLIDWLVAEGHSVDVRRNNWDSLDPNRIAELNAADLILVSRLPDSGHYDYGNAPTQWNSLKTPLLLMNAYFTRPIRWNWVNSEAVTNNTTSTYAEAVDPNHPVFRGVALASLYPGNPRAAANVVQIVDPTVGTGITSFLGTTDVGNGRLIAKPASVGMGWIAEWDAGVEFYKGAGQFAGGKRMLFCAGTQEVGNSRLGEFNLTPAGKQMLRNAIGYLLGRGNIILVTESIDQDLDGVRDDQALETFLVAEGYFVDVRPNYWQALSPHKIAELKAADLILFSRLPNSANYDDGDEPTQWNSLPVPLLLMNPYFARNIRWNWLNSEATTNNTAVVYLEAVEPSHPIFRNVPLTSLNPGKSPANTVRMIDPNVGSGITSFSGMAQVGNGRLIARPVGLNMGWIAEWDAGVEFYLWAGQYAAAKRLMFCAGTQEIQVVDPVTKKVMTTPQGALNLTPEGKQMFRNAIAYLLLPEPKPKR